MPLWLLAIMVLAVAGCQSDEQRHDAGAGLVSAYLRAASGEDELLGWPMLGSDAQSMFDGDVDQYLAVVRQADFAGLDWKVEEVESEDNLLFVRVRAERGTFPPYLSELRRSRTLASGSGEKRDFLVGFRLFGDPELRAYGG